MRRLPAAIAELREAWRGTADGLRHRVREVVVVACSSRGGSSMLAEILRQSTHLLHFQAEINPFLCLAGLTHPASGTGSDALHPDTAGDLDLLDEQMALEAGNRASGLPCEDGFAGALAWRLAVQWPAERFELSEVRTWVAQTLAELREQEGWPPGEFVDTTAFHLRFLRRVRSRAPAVNPYYYDLASEQVRRAFPGLPVPVGPPSGIVIEEPPFVAIGPWTPATAEDLHRLPLVIKTPSTAYRMAFMRRLFPQARFRVLHLLRSPAASINGLYDGWRYHGFHSHRVEPPLRIAGYSDREPLDACWWKFDLPPGWEDWTCQPLERVCAFQWRSAHRAILGYLDEEPADTMRLRFEDVVGDPLRRRACFEELAAWLRIPLEGAFLRAAREGLPPIMATVAPRQRRWYERAGLLEQVLAEPATRQIAERLGYGDPASWA